MGNTLVIRDNFCGSPQKSAVVYLLLAECEVRTTRYGPSFFFFLFSLMKTRKDKTKIHNLLYGPSKGD